MINLYTIRGSCIHESIEKHITEWKTKGTQITDVYREALRRYDARIQQKHSIQQFVSMELDEEAEVDEMIREADVDGDGHINYEEFVRMMMAK